MNACFTGIKWGLALACLVGPVFLTLLQTGIESGCRKGFFVALGISLSDTIFVCLCFYGLIQLVSNEAMRQPASYVGGGVLGLFGLYHLIIKARQKNIFQARAIVSRKWYNYMLKGFLINAFNPAVPIFWIGVISYVTIDRGYTASNFYIFFIAMLLTVLATDFLKVAAAHQLRSLITPAFLKALNIILGLALLIAGGRLIGNAYSS